MKQKWLHLLSVSALCLLLPFTALAQPQDSTTTPTNNDTVTTAPFTGSLMFSAAELAAIRRALAGRITGTSMLTTGMPQHIPKVRQISVAGVIYRKPGDWIVWLNGQKVTPKNLLPEIVDISVQKHRIHLKWFDIGINDVISISLRPHQTYDIVTGVLLPG